MPSASCRICNECCTAQESGLECVTFACVTVPSLLQVMFLFTDAHVANEGFLELINNMLTSGMIPALYDDGEKDALIAGIREEV